MKDVVPIHGSDHCPGGPDPIPCLTSNIAWIAAVGELDADGDTSPATNELYTELWLDEAPTTAQYFGYNINAGAGLGGLDAYELLIKDSGLYEFSFMAQTNDLNANTEYTYILSLELAHASSTFPAWFNTGIGNGWISWQESVKTDAAGQVSILKTVVVPMKITSQVKTGRVAIGNDPADSSSWTMRVWISRKGDITWTPSNFVTNTEGP